MQKPDTTIWVMELPETTQAKIKTRLTNKLRKAGYKGEELQEFITCGMESRLADLDYYYSYKEKIALLNQ